jgi:hypothetical protein
MHVHKNARLTPIMRGELVRSVVQDLVPLIAAAAEFNVTSNTAANVTEGEWNGSQSCLTLQILDSMR